MVLLAEKLGVKEAQKVGFGHLTVEKSRKGKGEDVGDVQPELPQAPEVKEVFKYIMAEKLMEASEGKLKFDGSSPFTIELHVDHPQTEKEFMFLTKVPTLNFQVGKQRGGNKGASVDKITQSINKLSYAEFEHTQKCPPTAVTLPFRVHQIKLSHDSIFVAGRYNKFQRHISNSPWEVKGVRKTEDSVEDLVVPLVKKLFNAEAHKFSSAGREDADVLMLGRGRPYYVELQNPKLHLDCVGSTDEAILKDIREKMAEVQRGTNEEARGKVGIRDLQIVSREDTKILKESASTKSKSYSCLVRLSSPVTQADLDRANQISDLEIKQRNPTRVPRRADLVRDKVIHTLHVRFVEESDVHRALFPPLGPPFDKQQQESSTKQPSNADTDNQESHPPNTLIRVDMKTSAGTYVKEFVHSDGGRTVPSLRDILYNPQWQDMASSIDLKGTQKAEKAGGEKGGEEKKGEGEGEGAATEVGENAKVVALDVLEVHLDWPPTLESSVEAGVEGSSGFKRGSEDMSGEVDGEGAEQSKKRKAE
ncbi:putative tRNA pseudouridine synthase Pus10 [Quaeritorhiza haematococci]|nr:putative tRNA pseudouridine synthase Pus10 [Quaeritorhiza haematococci]